MQCLPSWAKLIQDDTTTKSLHSCGQSSFSGEDLFKKNKMNTLAMVKHIPDIIAAITAIMNWFSGVAQAKNVDALIDDLEFAVRRHIDKETRLSPLEINDIRVQWTNLIRKFRFDDHHLDRLAEIKEDLDELGVRTTALPDRRGYFERYSKT